MDTSQELHYVSEKFNQVSQKTQQFFIQDYNFLIDEIKSIPIYYYFLFGIPLIYAIWIVIFMRNLIFKKLKFLEHPIQNLPDSLKPFERVDRKNWKIYEIYFCAIFLLPIRLTLVVISGIILSLINTVSSMTSPKENEQSMAKRSILKVIYRIVTRLWLLSFGACWIHKKNVRIKEYDEDYPEDDYKDRKQDKPPILICNHIGYLETIYMVNTRFVPSLLSKSEIEKMPILGNTMQAIQCIFVDRADRKNKDGVLNKIKERCDLIKEGKNYPPILLFPEGTTTNGKYLLSFKKGAFASFSPIKIFALKIKERNVSPYLCDNITILEHILLSFCNLYQNFEVFEFETFYPEHLPLNNNDDDWQIYAEKINKIMANALQVPQSQSGYRHVLKYRDLVNDYIKNMDKNSENRDSDIESQKKPQITEKTPLLNDQNRNENDQIGITPNLEGNALVCENSNKYGTLD